MESQMNSQNVCKSGITIKGKREGLWIFTYKNGTIAIGNFENDKMTGQWEFTLLNQDVEKGRFTTGKLTSNWLIVKPTGIIGVGKFENRLTFDHYRWFSPFDEIPSNKRRKIS